MLLNTAEGRGEPPLKILYMITRQIRLLVQAKEMLEEGLSQADVGRKLGIRDFYLKDFIKRSLFSRSRGKEYSPSLPL